MSAKNTSSNKNQLQVSVDRLFHRRWNVWYASQLQSDTSWGEHLRQVSHVATMKQFWALFAFIQRANQLPLRCGYFFVKDGVYPKSTDPTNNNGAVVVFPLSANEVMGENGAKQLNQYWTRGMAALAGEQFAKESMEQVAGISVTREKDTSRREFFKIALWLTDASNQAARRTIEREFRSLLNIPKRQILFFEPHLPKNVSRMHVPSEVIEISGLDQRRFNCDKIFNWLSTYGKCLVVSFLSDMCVVLMHSPADSSRVMKYLNGVDIFGDTIRVVMSRQRLPEECGLQLPDGSRSHKDFSWDLLSKSVAFEFEPVGNAEPSNMLSFYNVPASVPLSKVGDLIKDKSSIEGKEITLEHSSETTIAGFLAFKSKEEALEVLLACNNLVIVPQNPAAQKRCLKLKF